MTVMDQFGRGEFQLSVGMEDNDRIYLGLGVDCGGTKTGICWNSGGWDNQLYYPTWVPSATEGPPLNTADERGKVARNSGMALLVSPNPLRTAASITFANPLQDASIVITDISGRIVSKQDHIGGTHCVWNASDQPNGVYIIKLSTANNVFCKRVCFAK
jgi:hypothetical protein